MYLRVLLIAFIAFLLSSCSGRQIEIINPDNKVIGECYAGFNWHLYGIEDSIDYMLYLCAKEHVAKGHSISEPSLLDKDFTLATPPQGKHWNKKIAMQSYHQGGITEQQLGYILAAIEYDYMQVVLPAEDELAVGKISQEAFNKINKKARYIWLGE
jgi:hypothetical protein